MSWAPCIFEPGLASERELMRLRRCHETWSSMMVRGHCSSVGLLVARPRPGSTSMGLGATGAWDTTKELKLSCLFRTLKPTWAFGTLSIYRAGCSYLSRQELRHGPVTTSAFGAVSQREVHRKSSPWATGPWEPWLPCQPHSGALQRPAPPMSPLWVPDLAFSWLTTNSLSR